MDNRNDRYREHYIRMKERESPCGQRAHPSGQQQLPGAGPRSEDGARRGLLDMNRLVSADLGVSFVQKTLVVADRKSVV